MTSPSPSGEITSTTVIPRTLRVKIREGFVAWVTRRQRAATHEIRLDRRRIYILPTRHGYLYAVLLMVLLIGSTNYSNSMALLLTFVLAGLGVNALGQTHRNLLGLRIHGACAAPVFAGQDAQLRLQLQDNDGRTRPAIALQWGQHAITLTGVAAGECSDTEVMIPTRGRGLLEPGRFRIFTRHPMGLFQAWSWLEFEVAILVYPQPIDSGQPFPQSSHLGVGASVGRNEETDFSGLRDYTAGDSPRRIAWKAVARTDALLTKEFAEQARRQVWLQWEALPEADIERKLSILCHWVLSAEAQGLDYGLEIPGCKLAPGRGQLHRNECLRALALFGRPKQRPAPQ